MYASDKDIHQKLIAMQVRLEQLENDCRALRSDLETLGNKDKHGILGSSSCSYSSTLQSKDRDSYTASAPAKRAHDFHNRENLTAYREGMDANMVTYEANISTQQEITDEFVISQPKQRWYIATYTNKGNRSRNEDSIGVTFYANMHSPPRILAVLADGVGGHSGGGQASMFVSQMLHSRLGATVAGDPESILKTLIDQSNNALYRENNPAHTESGNTQLQLAEDAPSTTVVSLLIEGSRVAIGHVGDSRAYVLHQNIQRLTEDHSYRNRLTQAMGLQPKVDPVIKSIEVGNGHMLLLCSDGLTNELNDKEIQHITQRAWASGSMSNVVNELGTYAMQRGGKDNISIIALHHTYLREPTSAHSSKKKSRTRHIANIRQNRLNLPLKRLMLMVVFFVVFVILYFVYMQAF